MAGYPPYAQGRIVATQALDFTSTSAAAASAFQSQTYIVRLAATAPVHFKIYDTGAASTATSTDPLLPTNVVQIVGVTPGQRIAAVKASGGSITSADGRMTITEIA